MREAVVQITTQLPPVWEGAVADKLQRLRGLAVGLCQEAKLGVSLHDGPSCYHAESQQIGVPMTELIEHGELYCAGIIAHEVGHARICRYLDILKEGLFHWGMAGLLNVLEDGHSDTWMCRRYRGVRS